MSHIYDSYKIALLDASFFLSPFSDEVKKGLSNSKIYVAETFKSELEQYKLILSEKKQKVYEENIKFLDRNTDLNTLNFDSFGEQYRHLHNDIFGFVLLLVNVRARFVVITANQILIQKIVLQGLEVDIYDLNTNSFIKYEFFSTYQSRYKFSEITWTISATEEKIGSGTKLYRKNGRKIVLGEEINTGLEANLYLVKNSSNIVAKIFKQEKFSAGKFKNIKNLLEIKQPLETPWAIFPKDILYYDKDCKKPVGLIEDYVPSGTNLDDIALFLGNPFDVEEKDLSKKQSDIIDLCIKIVRQVCYLNSYGFLISDFNLGNLSIPKKESAYIQMWDTDSFGYDTFFGEFFSNDYVESNHHPKYDIRTKEGAITISTDALYQCIFILLSFGDAPISGYSRKFKYDNPNYQYMVRKNFFPSNVWNHMEEVFHGKKAPSAEMLMYELLVARTQFQKNSSSDKTVRQMFVEVIPNYEEIKKQTKEEVPEQENSERENRSDKKTEKKRKKLLVIIFLVIVFYVVGGYLWDCYFKTKIDNFNNNSEVQESTELNHNSEVLDSTELSDSLEEQESTVPDTN